MMKMKRNNKVYEYDYKTVWVQPDLHKEIKIMSVMEGKSMSETVQHLLNHYKKFG